MNPPRPFEFNRHVALGVPPKNVKRASAIGFWWEGRFFGGKEVGDEGFGERGRRGRVCSIALRSIRRSAGSGSLKSCAMTTSARFMFMAVTTKRGWQALIKNLRSLLPVFERVMGSPAPRYAVVQTATFERLAERLAVIGLVGEITLLVALDQRLGQTGVMDIGRSHLGLPDKSAPFIHSQMRLVAEMNRLALDRHPARPDHAGSLGRFRRAAF